MTEESPTIEDAINGTIEEMAEDVTEETPVEEAPLEVAPTEEISAGTEGEQPEAIVKDQSAGVGIDPPASWSSEYKEMFATLPPETQKYIAQRESEREAAFTQKTQEAADSIRFRDELSQVIEPRRHLLQSSGMTEAQGINWLFQQYEQLTANPAQFILGVAQSNGIDLSQFVSQEIDEFADPQVEQLRRQTQQLQSQLQNTTQYIQVQQAEQQMASANQQVAQFASATDAEGNLLHPHFEAVQASMVGLVQRGKTLEDAYAEAAKPFEAALEAQVAKLQEQQVAAAKAAKGTTAKTTGSATARGVETVNDGNWEDTVQEIAASVAA